ncbi:SSI family serine proteinase inhibitor [Actinokineospora sp.]|uniref:SSI family serine proteinase inhibitor n=1 Tax=Actinokineospora sp. TaxID=1872133 RepID=UPI00403781C6
MFRKTCALVLAITATAAVTPSASARLATSYLMLTVAGENQPARMGTLRCDPDGGTHPQAESACGELFLVSGDFAALAVDPEQACTLQYDPVAVTARGRWEGRFVDYRESFGNACELAVLTGSVFAL